MTRDEFFQDISDMGELFQFVYDYDLDRWELLADILDEEDFDDWISENYMDYLYNNCNWRETEDYLSYCKDLLSRYNYFAVEDYEPIGISDYGAGFNNVMSDVAEMLDNMNFFEDEDENGTDETAGGVREERQSESQMQVSFGVARPKVEVIVDEEDFDLDLDTMLLSVEEASEVMQVI